MAWQNGEMNILCMQSRHCIGLSWSAVREGLCRRPPRAIATGEAPRDSWEWKENVESQAVSL